MAFAAVTLDAELLNFWRGDRVLRIQRTTRDGASGCSLARFPRGDRPDSEEISAHYLASSLANERANEAGWPGGWSDESVRCVTHGDAGGCRRRSVGGKSARQDHRLRLSTPDSPKPPPPPSSKVR